MKRLLAILAFVMMTLAASAQVTNYNLPDCVRGFSTTATGRVAVFNNQTMGVAANGGGCTYWSLVYSAVNASAVSIEVDQAPDTGMLAGSWTIWPAAAVSGTIPLTTTTFSQTTMFGFAPWVSVNITTLTPTSGTASVTGILYGWRTQGTSDSSAGASPVNTANFGYKHISTNASTQVKSGSGYLHGISINTKGATANVLTLFDNTACSGTTIAVIDTTSNVQTLNYDIIFNVGLCALTAAGTAADITVAFK